MSSNFDMKKAVKVKFREPRECGLRKEGGLYLYGAGLSRPCDRGLMIISACPTCGERPRFTRGISQIDFIKLFGPHIPQFGEKCKDGAWCTICHPQKEANHYLMWVGRNYTMESFTKEAARMGVSKRIAQVPAGFVVGRDWVYLARKSVNAKEYGLRLDKGKRVCDAIFFAFKPTAIEYIVKEADMTNEKKIRDLVSRGITPILEVDKPDKRK